MAQRRFPMNTWPTPAPYGFPGAVESVGSVAAPMLAGFALTLLTLVVVSGKELRWPNLVLLGFALAAVLLINAVQFSFWARQYAVKPSEAIEWHPDFETQEGREAVRRDLWSDYARFGVWAKRARFAYNLGTVVLLASVSGALVPDGPLGQVPVARWLAVAVPLLGVLGEGTWAVLDRCATHQERTGKQLSAGLRWLGTVGMALVYPRSSQSPPEERYATDQTADISNGAES